MAVEESNLRREIRQKKPFRSRQQEAVLALQRTTALLKRRGARLVEAHGISLEQYNVLRILRGADPESLPTLEIVERMVEPSPAITRLLDKLESNGFVNRARSLEDRRQVLCSITPKGLDLLARLDEPIDREHQDTIRLSRDDLDALIRLLDKVRAALA